MTLIAKIEDLQNELIALQQVIVDLQGRLALHSTNSSKPPSSDGLRKPKPPSKPLRKAGQKPSGEQKRHSGSTLCQGAEPAHVMRHLPQQPVCAGCQRRLKTASVADRRRAQCLTFLCCAGKPQSINFFKFAAPGARCTENAQGHAKTSGWFRTQQGAKSFCVIRSHMASRHKRGANLFASLRHTFLGCPPQPSFA